MTIDDHPSTKVELRRLMRQILGGPSRDDNATCQALHEWLSTLDRDCRIAAYAALPDEVDLAPVLARHPRHQWIYPRVDGESLTFHPIADPQREMAPGAFGIPEPVAGLPCIDLDDIDIFLCPGMAFDARGGRLGRGRGFYDRILENARPDAIKVGICQPAQMVQDTFGEAHDIAMDRVISGS